MHALRLLISLYFLAFSSPGFAAEDPQQVTYREMIEQNLVSAAKVTKGMTRDEVMRVMGNIQSKVKSGPIDNPWKVEFHGDMEVLHYITSGHPPFFPIMANQATPIILRDGKVIGVGRGILKEINASDAIERERSTTPEVGIEERLRTLEKLYEDGMIDKKAYEAQKTRILESI